MPTSFDLKNELLITRQDQPYQNCQSLYLTIESTAFTAIVMSDLDSMY